MINPASGGQSRTYSMKDVYAEAMRYMKDEVQKMKKAPLSKDEEIKLEHIAKSVSNEVIKEMRI